MLIAVITLCAVLAGAGFVSAGCFFWLVYRGRPCPHDWQSEMELQKWSRGKCAARDIRPAVVSSRGDLEGLAISLLNNEMPARKPVRLLGVSLSSLLEVDGHEPQLDLPI